MKLRQAMLHSLAPAMLLTGGAALADAVGDFGGYQQYTVTAGAISATCTAGYTCATLNGSGTGILQRQISLNSDPTNRSYIQSIVVDQAATATNAAAVTALGFRNESWVGISGDARADVGIEHKVTVDGAVQNGNLGGLVPMPGVNEVVALINKGDTLHDGFSAGVNEKEVILSQSMDLDVNAPGAWTMDFDQNQYYAGAGDVAAAGGSYRIDSNQPTAANLSGGQHSYVQTFRASFGAETDCAAPPCSLTLADGTSVTYNAGDDISTNWLASAGIWGGGGHEIQTYTNRSTGDFAQWSNLAPFAEVGFFDPADPGAGGPYGAGTATTETTALFGAGALPYENTALNDWNFWDANFGAAPRSIYVTGVDANGAVTTLGTPLDMNP